jgi:hypothetical protein
MLQDFKISSLIIGIKHFLVRISSLEITILVISNVLCVLSILVKIITELFSGLIFSKSVQMQPVGVHTWAHLSEIIELDFREIA